MNKSLLDDMKQSPAFIKFQRDLSMQETESRVHMDGLVKQAEHISSIILKHLVPKLKDPGSYTISCVIGNYTIDGALLDLGASVNILSYSTYQKLNPGVFQPTSVSICLADRSLKQPWGVVEDVVVNLDSLTHAEFEDPLEHSMLKHGWDPKSETKLGVCNLKCEEETRETNVSWEPG
ncbi:uncharacterized protein LOC131167428 [Malania oleifera]|uniref:uncharacterized protein LOC131167428 n=1 Tax=Malania oleifera TaxID=397392 RepID=UPI0025AE45E4|nr:uncharacterized protein LOC131167428 [Malania oleifera]